MIFRTGAHHDVTLGEGADTVKLYGSISGTTRAEGSIVIQDFLAGNGGDRFDLEDYLRAKLQGWTTDQNPFATGHLKLVQSGADTLLQIDIDGSAGGAGFTTLATLRNATPQSFTASNFGGRDPFASTGPSVIDGSAGNDTLNGSDRDDTIRGFGGDDRLDGGRGSDRLEGGEGNDRLESYAGANDILLGEGGNDTLIAERPFFDGSPNPAELTLDGGAGADTLSFLGSGVSQNARLLGGEDADTMSSAGGGTVSIDGGGGNDVVSVSSWTSSYSVALGAGIDRLNLAPPRNGGDPIIGFVVTDFQAGAGGDELGLHAFMKATLTNWDERSNPFATGHLRLVQSGADTLLQVDRDGSANGESFTTLLTLRGVTASQLITPNLDGYPPDGSAPASAASLEPKAMTVSSAPPATMSFWALAATTIWAGKAGTTGSKAARATTLLTVAQARTSSSAAAAAAMTA